MSVPPINRIADIACIIRAGMEVPEAGLRQAVKLASEFGAHLSITVAAQHVVAPYSPIWTGLASSLVGDLNGKIKAKAEQAADVARTVARIAAVIADVAVVFDDYGESTVSAVLAARASDLIVVDQPDAVLDAKSAVLEEALFRSGRPVMVATPKRPPIGAVSKAMLAWDGTAHAARAAGDLLNLFNQIKHVDIVSVLGDKDMGNSLPGADYARHLSRKGIHANLVELSNSNGSVADLLDGFATKSGADLIAMGGYGHSRLRQFILGGVTVTMIRQSANPLLMSY